MAFPSYCERNPMNCIQKAVAPKLPPQGYAEADFKLVENWALLRQSVGGIVQQALVDAQRAGGFGVITFTKETGYSLGLDEIADLQMGITEWTWNLLGDRMEGNLFDNWTAKGKPRFSFAYNEVARRIGIPLLFDDRHPASPFNKPPPAPTSNPKTPPKPYVRLERDGETALDDCIERVSTTVTAGPPKWEYHITVRNNCEEEKCFKYRVRFHGGEGGSPQHSGPLTWSDKCIPAGEEVVLEGEMPWYRVNTIDLQIDPPGSFLDNEDPTTIHEVDDASPKTDALDDAAMWIGEKVGVLATLFAKRSGTGPVAAQAYGSRANAIAYRVAAAMLLPFYPAKAPKRKFDTAHDVGDTILSGRKIVDAKVVTHPTEATTKVCFTVRNKSRAKNCFEYRIRWLVGHGDTPKREPPFQKQRFKKECLESGESKTFCQEGNGTAEEMWGESFDAREVAP